MRGLSGPACVVLIGVAIPGQAAALAITSATCSQQAGNSLRFDCSVAVDGAAEVWVAFCEDNGGACAYDRFTPHTVLGAAGTATVTMFGMAAAEDYDWRAVAKQGSTMAYGARTDVATGSLPAEMADITFTTWGTPIGVHNVVFNYACEQASQDEHDWIVIADTSGRVVWYENPADVLGTKYPIAALNIARPEKHILVVVGRTYILEYDLNGELVRLYCRDDSSTAGLQCDDAGVSPDAYFTDFVHHDVSVLAAVDERLRLGAHELPLG